ncbi:hypothetical protein PIIN_06592 [Serendipita indica DSM 11827]|uniref:Uncharacterized protein n=1 Tax=Serendipita indica (strain DSM 11827) TaxID=1109443 RepID=G4TMW2_SERID|nr:hypothetical protein PIIN_06592 [Serendipita indica DSM 11827]
MTLKKLIVLENIRGVLVFVSRPWRDLVDTLGETIPNVRCLIIGGTVNSVAGSHAEFLSLCYFPKLTMFRLLSGHSTSVSKDIIDSFSNHARLFEEIELGPHLACEAANGCSTSSSRMCTSNRPQDLTDASGMTALIVKLTVDGSGYISKESVAHLQTYRWAVRYIRIHTFESWAELLKTVRDGKRTYNTSTQDYCRNARDGAKSFLDTVDEMRFLAFDCGGKPASCDEARELWVLASDTSW